MPYTVPSRDVTADTGVECCQTMSVTTHLHPASRRNMSSPVSSQLIDADLDIVSFLAAICRQGGNCNRHFVGIQMYGEGWMYGMPAVLCCTAHPSDHARSPVLSALPAPEAANIPPLPPSTPPLVSRGYCSGFTQTTQTQTQQEAIPNTGYACVG